MARSLAGRCGIPAEGERVYVHVDATVEPGEPAARTIPRSVQWPDARTWRVQSVLGHRAFGTARRGDLVERYDVMILGRPKTLWRDARGFFAAKLSPSRPGMTEGIDARSSGL